jgi:hypothetical protein
MRRVPTAIGAAGVLFSFWIWQSAVSQDGPAGVVRDAARYTRDGGLQFPADADRWIPVGTGIGGEYADEPFDPANPGVLSLVQMEPSAYDFFFETGEYADGTMFLLSFYEPLEKPDPELPGFMQGELLQREIHVIDSQRFAEEGRGFFMFPPEATVSPAPMPLGSECTVCHEEHGGFRGTFTQFYPRMRAHIADLAN